MTLLLIYLLLLLLLPPTLSTPTGLAASFHSRPAAYGPGEIRTTDLSQTLTPATLGFTYSLSFKFPQTFNSIAIPGEIYPQGHLLTLDTGSTIAARTTLSFLTIYDTPSVNILGYLSLNGPNLLHFHTNSSDWHHVIVSVDFENNTVTHAIDDIVKTETPEVSLREMYTEAMFGDGATGDEETPVYLRLGFDERYGNGWHGLIDNVCVYGEGLSQEEMREVQVSPTCPPLPSLWTSLTFDSDRETSPSVYDDVTDSYIGYTSGVTEANLHLDFGAGDVVTLTLANGEGALPSGEIGHVCDFGPTGLTPCTLTPFLPSTYTLLKPSPTGSLNEGVFTPSAVAGFHKLTLSTGPLYILTATAPTTTASRVPYYIPHNAGSLVFVSNPGDVSLRNSPYTTFVRHECVGLSMYQWTWELTDRSVAWYHTQYGTPPPTAAPVDGDDDPYYYDDYYYPPEAYEDSFYAVTEFAGTGDADLVTFSSDGYCEVTDYYGRVFIVPDFPVYDAEYECVVEYYIDDGLASKVGSVTVRQEKPPYVPTVDPVAYDLVEDSGMSEIEIGAESDDKETVYMTVEYNGNCGTFYQDDGVTVIDDYDGKGVIEQYAVAATASTEWPGVGTNTVELLGRPNLWPLAGDLGGAWQPYYGTHGEVVGEEGDIPFVEQSVTVEVTTPVYLRQVSVYETYLPNCITEVWAKDHDDPSAPFVKVWSRLMPPPPTPMDALIANVDDITVCTTVFRTKFVKLVIQIESESHWYAIDAVSVQGVEQQASNILYSNKLFFRPNNDFNGVMKAIVTVQDCPFYLKERNTNAAGRSNEILISVAEVNDPPRFSPSIDSTTYIDASGSGCAAWVSQVCFHEDDPRYDAEVLKCGSIHSPAECIMHPLTPSNAALLQKNCPVSCDSDYDKQITVVAAIDDHTNTNLASLVSDVEDLHANLTYTLSDLVMNSHGTAQIDGSECIFTPNEKAIAGALEEVELNIVLIIEATATLTVTDKDGGASSAIVTWRLEGLGTKTGGLNITIALISGAILLVATITLTVIVQKFSNKKVEFEEEKALTPDEKLQKVCDTLIQGQQAWLAFELVDAFSDVANGVMVVQEGTMNPTFLVLFVIIALFSVFAGINAIVKRKQVINGVRKIRDGDEETMEKFKDGAEGGIVTVHNPALQWELTTAEIHVSELAATNGLVEDFPSLVLNVVSLVIQFNHPDFQTSPQFYVSFGALLVSCITGGRKTYLKDKLRALRAKKGEIEADMKKQSGSRLSIVRGSLKMTRQLDVEGGELRGAGGVGKGARVVPVIGGEDIKALEGESATLKIARLEREKEITERDLKAVNEELADLKKNN